MGATIRVRFYFGDRDYEGKIVNVKRITLRHNGSGSVETEQGDRFDCTNNFVLMGETQMKIDRQTGYWVITAS